MRRRFLLATALLALGGCATYTDIAIDYPLQDRNAENNGTRLDLRLYSKFKGLDYGLYHRSDIGDGTPVNHKEDYVTENGLFIRKTFKLWEE